MWDHSSFTKNRERLLNEAVGRAFFGKVLGLAEWKGLVSSEHFTVDGALIEAWASMKSFKAKDGSGKPPEDGGRNPTVDFKGEKRSNDTHASTTDPQARLKCGYAVSLRKRKLVEEIFGWVKTIGGLRKAKFIGLAKAKAQTVFTLAAYNLMRMATIFGWRLNTV